MADTFSDEVKKELLERLAEGMSLREACEKDGMPSAPTVCRWNVENAEWAEQYTRAREVGYQLMADEILGIADDGTNDIKTIKRKDGTEVEVTDYDVIARSKLRVDTRKWMLSKMLPKIYGEKITNEHTGEGGGPLEVKVVHEIVDPRADS
jgi:hypothetical protein